MAARLAVLACLLHGICGLRLAPDHVVRSFHGYKLQHELAAALFAAQNAAAVPQRGDSSQCLLAEQVLQRDLTAEAALSPLGQWIWHADADICVALVGAEGAVLSLCHRPAERLTLFAVLEDGAYVRRDGVEQDDECVSGGASQSANVLHLPASDMLCPQLNECLEHLQNIGTGMPLETIRKEGRGACEGLADVVLSRADVHLAPPTRFFPQQPATPPEVLCTFELLLAESGGSLTDVYGDGLDVGAALSEARGRDEDTSDHATAALMRRGVLAAVECCVPYFTRAMLGATRVRRAREESPARAFAIRAIGREAQTEPICAPRALPSQLPSRSTSSTAR